MKNRIIDLFLVFSLAPCLFLVGGCSGTRGSAPSERVPKLSLEKADVLITGRKVDTTYYYGARHFTATLKNRGSVGCE